MALIKCPECGKEISNTTNACIHCGYTFLELKTNEVEKELKILSQAHQWKLRCYYRVKSTMLSTQLPQTSLVKYMETGSSSRQFIFVNVQHWKHWNLTHSM